VVSQVVLLLGGPCDGRRVELRYLDGTVRVPLERELSAAVQDVEVAARDSRRDMAEYRRFDFHEALGGQRVSTPVYVHSDYQGSVFTLLTSGYKHELSP
jgi:hypothetical protein